MNMNAKKRVNGSWVDAPYYIHKTAADTFTTLPVDVYADGNNATVGLKGNTVQNGTPTPDSPVMPEGTGERTGNLFDKSQPTTLTNKYLLRNGEESSNAPGWAASAYIPVSGYYVTLTGVSGNLPSICAYDSSKQFVRGKNYENSNKTTIDISDCSFVRFSYVPTVQGDNAMLNTGSIALYYEPYGYKIPISSANTTTTVYLGEAQTMRRIAKIDLGTLNWGKTASGNFWAATAIQNIRTIGNSSTGNAICDMFKEVSPNTVANEPYSFSSCLNVVGRPFINRTGFEDLTVEEFKEAMSGVYMYYVLATPETGIINEPLMKIGDYADEVSNISIPTITGKNIVDVETVLKPSEVSFNYAGWHTAVVHKRINGAWD